MEPMHPVERSARYLAYRDYMDRNPDCDVEEAFAYEDRAWWAFEVEAMEDLGIHDDDDADFSEEELERQLEEEEKRWRMDELDVPAELLARAGSRGGRRRSRCGPPKQGRPRPRGGPSPACRGRRRSCGFRASQRVYSSPPPRPTTLRGLAMSEVSHLLAAIEQGDPHAADQLLPLVYDELRRLAARQLAQEKPGQTLQATALVHEAYLRLVGPAHDAHWNSRGHFIAAAAEAMRRILVENARRKKTEKYGGTRRRIDLAQTEPITQTDPEALLDLDSALTLLANEDPLAAQVAKLRLFAGLSVEEAAQALSTSRATAYRQWAYARAWLHARLRDEPSS
jgi:RNA polymerase sigma factor (TIGR02999 family)